MNNFATFIHIELTNRCNKSCWCCGRRKLEKEYPHLANFNKNMEFELIKSIAKQLPNNTVVHLHNNGEPTLYPKLKEAIKLFKNQITHFDTNAILLLEKSDDIIDNLDILTISVIENDPLGDEQFEIVKKFLKLKKDKKPRVVFRLLGNVSKFPLKNLPKNKKMIKDHYCEGCEYFKESAFPNCLLFNTVVFDDGWGHIREEACRLGYDFDWNREKRWYNLAKEYNCLIATRVLHDPMGSFKYRKKVTIPEYGICQEILTHLAINVDGDVSVCVRFDPLKKLVMGNVKKQKLIDIWNSKKRLKMLKEHIKGNRNCNEICTKCDYYGYPIS